MSRKSRYKRATPGGGQLFLSDGSRVDVANWINASKDPVTNGIIQLTYPHAAVHKDTIVNASHYTASGEGDVLYFFTTGATLLSHLEYHVIGSAACRVLFYEEPDINAQGAIVPAVRLDRASSKATQATVRTGGTVNGGDYGTLLKEQSNGGGGQGSGVHGGSAVHDDAEWLLKPSTAYCLRIIRGAAGTVGVELEWYEV